MRWICTVSTSEGSGAGLIVPKAHTIPNHFITPERAKAHLQQSRISTFSGEIPRFPGGEMERKNGEREKGRKEVEGRGRKGDGAGEKREAENGIRVDWKGGIGKGERGIEGREKKGAGEKRERKGEGGRRSPNKSLPLHHWYYTNWKELPSASPKCTDFNIKFRKFSGDDSSESPLQVGASYKVSFQTPLNAPHSKTPGFVFAGL